MKLNDFLYKSPKIRSNTPRIITVSNEHKEKEMADKIIILQQEVDRLHKVDSERDTFNQRMQASEILLHETLEREIEFKAKISLLETEVFHGQSLSEEKRFLEDNLKEVNGKLGVQESILEQSQKNNLELNHSVEALTRKVDELQTEEARLNDRLKESVQNTSASINSLSELKTQFESTTKIISEIQVKYREGQQKNIDLTQQAHYWERVARTLQEEKDSLEHTRHMLQTWASEVEADNQETKGAVKVTQSELNRLKRTNL